MAVRARHSLDAARVGPDIDTRNARRRAARARLRGGPGAARTGALTVGPLGHARGLARAIVRVGPAVASAGRSDLRRADRRPDRAGAGQVEAGVGAAREVAKIARGAALVARTIRRGRHLNDQGRRCVVEIFEGVDRTGLGGLSRRASIQVGSHNKSELEEPQTTDETSSFPTLRPRIFAYVTGKPKSRTSQCPLKLKPAATTT